MVVALHSHEVLKSEERVTLLVVHVQREDARIELATAEDAARLRDIAGLLRDGALDAGVALDGLETTQSYVDVPLLVVPTVSQIGDHSICSDRNVDLVVLDEQSVNLFPPLGQRGRLRRYAAAHAGAQSFAPFTKLLERRQGRCG